MRFSNTITIARPPAEVFAFLAQLENLPQWNYAISETRKVTPGPLGVGSKFHQARTLPTQSVETIEISDYQPDRRLAIQGGFGPFMGRATYLLDPEDPGTRLTNELDLAPTGLVSLASRLVAARVSAAVAENLGTLRHILESS
ncbi:MAG: SRPBCC family protein [Nitrolancea sp.]